MYLQSPLCPSGLGQDRVPHTKLLAVELQQGEGERGAGGAQHPTGAEEGLGTGAEEAYLRNIKIYE